MKTSLLLAASFLTAFAIAGCSSDTTEDSTTSSNDITQGDPRNSGTGADYNTQKPEEAPLPELDGNGAEGSVTAKKLIRIPASLNLKPVLEFPKPPVEGPKGEEIAH